VIEKLRTSMEILLDSLIDWLHKALKRRAFLKWLLIGVGWWIARLAWAP